MLIFSVLIKRGTSRASNKNCKVNLDRINHLNISSNKDNLLS